MTELNQTPDHQAKQPRSNHLNPLPNQQQISISENEPVNSQNYPENHSIKTTSFLHTFINISWAEFIKKLLSINKVNLVFTNIILAFVAGFGGMNIARVLGNKSSDMIAPDEICKELNTELVVKEVNVISSPSDANVDNVKFGCEYITQTGEKQTVYIKINALDEVKHNYQQIPIEEKHLHVLCGDSRLYLPKLQEKGYSEYEYNFIDEGAVLLEGESIQSLYPVFRWVCQYELTEKIPDNSSNIDNNNELKFGNASSTIVRTGIDMDNDLCRRKYKQQNLIKASYHDHTDPHSWYCTNTEFNLR